MLVPPVFTVPNDDVTQMPNEIKKKREKEKRRRNIQIDYKYIFIFLVIFFIINICFVFDIK